eukprot:3435188-Amphidinium_carterae.2
MSRSSKSPVSTAPARWESFTLATCSAKAQTPSEPARQSDRCVETMLAFRLTSGYLLHAASCGSARSSSRNNLRLHSACFLLVRIIRSCCWLHDCEALVLCDSMLIRVPSSKARS